MRLQRRLDRLEARQGIRKAPALGAVIIYDPNGRKPPRFISGDATSRGQMWLPENGREVPSAAVES